jgi:coenzyme F420-0:L-glutamate ligase / coenzyme F420-1:gamma-L-glutamate ligase
VDQVALQPALQTRNGAAALTVTALGGLPTVKAGDNLAALTLEALSGNGITLAAADVLVLAQKIVSKAEGRIVRLDTVVPSRRAKEMAAIAQKDPRVVELILSESVEILRCKPGVIVVQDKRGFVMANAGIDESNVEGDGESVLLLPVDPDASAAAIREAVLERAEVSVGVVINDSFGRAWRLGTVGSAVGVAGIPGLLDLRGSPDRNGRVLQSSELAVADEVAAAASLMMGQGSEGRPIVHMRGVPYDAAPGHATDLVRPKQMDLFR